MLDAYVLLWLKKSSLFIDGFTFNGASQLLVVKSTVPIFGYCLQVATYQNTMGPNDVFW